MELIHQLISLAQSWHTWALIGAMFVGGAVIDQEQNYLPGIEILRLQALAYLFGVPLALLSTWILMAASMVPESVQMPFFLSFLSILLMIFSCLFKTNIAEVGREGDYAAAQIFKTGILLVFICVLWML